MRVGGKVGGDHVGGDREVHEQAAILAVLGQHGDAGRHGVRRASRAQLAAVDRACCPTGLGVRRRSPRRPPCARRRAGPRGTGSRRSAARTRPRPPGRRRGRGPRGRRQRPAAARRGSGSKESSRPTISEISSPLGDRRRLAHAGDAAILQDRDPVRDLEDLRHAVRDVDDRDALRGEAPDDPEQVAALVDGQRRGRLVEDQELELVRQALGDLDHLLLARATAAHRRARVDVDLEIGQDPARALVHRAAADDAEAR